MALILKVTFTLRHINTVPALHDGVSCRDPEQSAPAPEAMFYVVFTLSPPKLVHLAFNSEVFLSWPGTEFNIVSSSFSCCIRGSAALCKKYREKQFIDRKKKMENSLPELQK